MIFFSLFLDFTDFYGMDKNNWKYLQKTFHQQLDFHFVSLLFLTLSYIWQKSSIQKESASRISTNTCIHLPYKEGFCYID